VACHVIEKNIKKKYLAATSIQRHSASVFTKRNTYTCTNVFLF